MGEGQQGDTALSRHGLWPITPFVSNTVNLQYRGGHRSIHSRLSHLVPAVQAPLIWLGLFQSVISPRSSGAHHILIFRITLRIFNSTLAKHYLVLPSPVLPPNLISMGGLCSKSANQDNQFSTPGRVLGSSSQNQPTSAPVPQKIISSTPGRTVGGSGAAAGGDDPRSAAAKAAEVC